MATCRSNARWSLILGIITLAILIAVIVFIVLSANNLTTFGIPFQVVTVAATPVGGTSVNATITGNPNTIYQIQPIFNQTLTINKPASNKLAGTTFYIDNTANPNTINLLPGAGVVLPSNITIMNNTAAQFYWFNDSGTLRRLFYSSQAPLM